MSTERAISFIALTILFSLGCQPAGNQQPKENVLTILHAGSLSVPLKMLADSFALQHPGVRFRMEAAGSLETIRKLTELSRKADIVAVSDEKLIRELLIPYHAKWSLPFAGNEMVIVYSRPVSADHKPDQHNWFELLTAAGRQLGRSDPDLDPCGYRTVLVLQLAEKFYNQPGLTDKVLEMSRKNVRPKETDLIALLQTGHLDYAFLYRSIAVQHKMPFVELPKEINLSDPAYGQEYLRSVVEVRGRKPGEKISLQGEPITYGLTIPDHAPNRLLAEQFVAFIAGPGGRAILKSAGHRPLDDSYLTNDQTLPDFLFNKELP
ncbi:MAG: substrate-binding domain-containing protein [Bacteroidetes bacterium]|nr:substrate-binding domain-containing protein [Bacteroidota bacterium]